MIDLSAFLAHAYEDLADLDGLGDLEGLDEVMYQTGIVLALARVEVEESSRMQGDDDGGATD